MKFFVPHASDEAEAESVRTSVRTFLGKHGFHTEEDRIQRITFRHNSKPYDLAVGKLHPDLHEDVLLIFKAAQPNLYFACAANRGVVRGEPYLIGGGDGTRAYLFDD